MKHGKITRSSDRTVQSSEFDVAAPRLRPSVHAVRHALRGIAAVTALQLVTPHAFALPTGEVLISGTATVTRNGTNTVMDINQTTQKAGYNWTSFSIAAPETVNVAQPNSSSVLLNRVVGTDQSQIFGALNANGKVFLVNPNGILFAPGAAVNVGGLVASTLDITTSNFENGGVLGTPYVFERVGGSAAASVVNQANIAITVPGSYAALIGANVSNEGTISVVSSTIAGRGAAALAAGDRVTLNVVGDNLINLSVDAAVLGASVLNKNGAQILADGGTVFLTARSADALLGTVINNSGIIQATTLVAQDGRIFLDGGAGGVSNSGSLSAGAGGSVNSTGGDFSNTGTISAGGAAVDVNHTGAVAISGGVTSDTMSVTGSGIEITNSGATLLTVGAASTQTFTATQGDLNITNTGTGQLVVSAASPTGVQTFNALHGDINISSSGTGGVQVRTSGPGSAQTFDTVTGALAGSTGNMTVKGTGGDVLVSSQAGTQTIKLKGDLTVGDAAATKSTELAFNTSQVVNAATINVFGGTGNTAGATLHSFGGQSITATGAINITGGTAAAFTVIPGFVSSPSASILNNTTGTQDIKAATININGGSAGSGNSASIGNFANSLQKVTADTINVTGGSGSTTNTAAIQSGNNTFVSTLDLHAGTLNINGQTASGAVGGGNNSVIGINVTGDTTLTGGANGGGAAIGLLGTTTNNTSTINFSSTGNLLLKGGTGPTPGSALIGAGQNHTNPTVNISVSAANITLAPTNGGNTFIGNSNAQPIAGNGNISLTATNGDISLNASPDTLTLSAIRTAGATGGTVSLTASGDINVAGRILTSNATDSAIVLRAGNGKAAGDATGGNVKLASTAQISVGAGGRATLFTGSLAGSTGVANFIGSGSGHFRYNSNPTTTNYTLALGAGNYAVYREQPLLDVNVTSTLDKTYGTNDPTPQTFTAAGYVNGDSAGLSGTFGRIGGESVGLYNVTKGTLASDVGYGFSFNQALTINAAATTASVASQAKTYGTNDPTLPIAATNLTGLVNTSVTDWNGTVTPINDSALTSQANTLARNVGENVGSYAITGGTFTAPSSNYLAPTFSGAGAPALAINQATLTATINNQNKTYGTDDPSLAGITVNVAGVVNTQVTDWNGNHTQIDDSANVSSSLTSLTRNAGETVAGSPYAITAGSVNTALSGGAVGNYADLTVLSVANNPTLAINAAATTASVANQAKIYGNDDPTLPIPATNVTGLVNRTVSDWNGNATPIDDHALTTQALTLARNTGENVGSYLITGGTFTALSQNYLTPTFAGTPTLTINQATTTASVANQTKTYGADDPTLPIPATNLTGLVNTTVTDWNNNHTLINDSALTSQALTLARNAGESVGSYLITGGTFSAPSTNYVAPTFSGAGAPALAINAAATTASVASQTKIYGNDDPTLPIAATNMTGLVNRTVTDWNNNHTLINDSALTSQALTLARNAGENVGPYLITGGTFTAPSTNYLAPTFAGAPTLTINAKTLIVTAQDATKIYDGNTSSSVAPTVSGLVNRTVTDWNGHGTVIADTSGFTQTYDNKDVGTGKTLTAAGVAIDGNGGANYAPTFIVSTNGVITRLNSVLWTGAGGNNLWSNAANWQGGAIPDKANVADVNLNGASVVFNNSVPALAGSVQVNNVSGGALTVNGGTLNVSNGATLTGYSQSAGATQVGGNLSITSTAPVTQTGGSLVVTGTSTVGAGGAAITLNSASNDFKDKLTVIGGTVKAADANGLTIQLTNTGETYVIANAGGGTPGDLTIGGTSGNLTAVSNGGTVVWNNLTGTNVILVAGIPVINGTANAGGITGPSTTGNVLASNVTYNNRGDARGTNLRANGELIIIARDIPGAPADSSASAATAILDIANLNPENRLQLVLDNPNGKLRLLVDQGAFRFRAGSQFPGGVSVPNPKNTQVFIGNQKLDATPDAASSAISAAQQSALNSASSDARQSFGTDSVTQQIDMGFAGDVGIAPTMAHNVPLQGEIISTPEGVTESKGGQ